MIITFCGHSNYTESEEDKQRILSVLEQKVGDNYVELYLGGYGNFDNFARKCGKKYKEKHPNTKLILITPYITPEYQKNHLQYQKELYDEIIYPELEKVPPRFAISYRNKWMVEKSDLVIAYIKRNSGGAYNTYKYAKQMGKSIFNLTEKMKNLE